MGCSPPRVLASFLSSTIMTSFLCAESCFFSPSSPCLLTFCLYLFKPFHGFEDFLSDGLDLLFSLVSRLFSWRLFLWRRVLLCRFRWFCLSWDRGGLGGFGLS